MTITSHQQHLVDLLVSGKEGKIRWFKRGMNELSSAEQNKVWKILHDMGHERIPLSKAEKDKTPVPIPSPSPVASSEPLSPPPAPVTPPPPPVEPEPSSERKSKVFWGDDDWDHLADIVVHTRLNDTVPALATLAARAQQQFPEHLRRDLTGAALKPLVDRLETRFLEMMDAVEQCKRLRDRIQQMKEAPTKESIIASLTDAEVLAHFKQRVFDQVAMADLVGGYEPEDILECLPIANVVGFAVRSLMENFGDGLTGHLEKITCLLEGLNKPQLPTNGSGAVPKSHTGFRDGGVRKPKVTVIGMKPNQINETRRKLGEKAVFNFVDKNRSTDYIPEGTDIVGVMANFVSHADQNHAINHCKTRCKEAIRIIHKGGVKRMCILLNDAIRQKTQVALV